MLESASAKLQPHTLVTGFSISSLLLVHSMSDDTLVAHPLDCRPTMSSAAKILAVVPSHLPRRLTVRPLRGILNELGKISDFALRWERRSMMRHFVSPPSIDATLTLWEFKKPTLPTFESFRDVGFLGRL